MSASDARIVQYASAGLIASGLLITLGAGALFPLRTSLSNVTAGNPVPWAPRDFGGAGAPSKSPVYGVMWSLIYAGELFYSVALVIAAFQGEVDMDVSRMFNHAACVFSALLMSSLWSPLFAENKRWCLLLASVVLVTTACVVMLGAILATPFLTWSWWDDVGGAVTGLFAGWATVAAALNVGTVTRVYNRGLNKGETNDGEYSFFPISLASGLSILAIVFANPMLPVPLFVALFFVNGIFKDWRIWGAAIVCLLGIVIGTGVVFGRLETATPTS